MVTRLLLFQSCPNRHLAGARLWQALRAISAATAPVTWQTVGDAGQLAFRGSPIMAERRCRFAGPAGRAGRACREFPGAIGTRSRIAGQILGVLINAA